MIVGTEGTTIDTPEQGSGTTPGPGTPVNEGETEPGDTAQTKPDQAQQAPPKKGQSGTGSGQNGSSGGDDADNSPNNGNDGDGGKGGGDKEPSADPRYPFVRSSFLADAMKPAQAAADDLYSSAPDKMKARGEKQAAYRKALGKDGALATKLQAASEKFDDLVSDLERDGRIEPWISTVVNGVLKQHIADRTTVPEAVRGRAAKYESARTDAQARTKAWGDRYTDWASPTEKITAQLGQYADKIDAVRSDISDPKKRDLALTIFWLEIAPQHLQLLGKDPAGAEVVKQVHDALPEKSDLRKKLEIGAKRFPDDGSLYRVEPGELEAKQKDVLGKWQGAAGKQADAEATSKIYNDDTASLKQRADKLKDDAWLADAKALVEASAP